MMSGHVDHLLQDYVDGSLAAEERMAIEQHLSACSSCREEYESIRLMLADLQALRREIEPAHDLWGGIERRIVDVPAQPAGRSPEGGFPLRRNGRRRRFFSSERPFATRNIRRWSAGVTAVIIVVVGVFLFRSEASWEVVRLEGAPSIAERPISGEARLRKGEWLVTDQSSRARVEVGAIGQVDVEPGTSLQIRNTNATDHRIALSRGTIEARIFAPPRLFIVETPSATAIDLGCVYSLTVDSSGMSILHVKAGYVELVLGGRVSIVPAGMIGLAKPGHGPGTTFRAEASDAFRDALFRFDFGDDRDAALEEILVDAGPFDGLTLWQVLGRAPYEYQPRVYDRLTEFVAPPQGVSREGALKGDPAMIAAWEQQLGLDGLTWVGYLKKKIGMSSAE